eukprot:TRINITY_DN37304_c0_g1_i1.p1 TRINITY_DN37304_c0_g1~~TRINITY_DN37304_c0_g1_i1.p1  ORF type:complete len:396 (-),score=57.18 TRINITY_DN37304_c0_g1_i1:316-1503(-)
MAFTFSLSHLCPRPDRDVLQIGVDDADADTQLHLIPNDGPPICCHAGLVRARCPLLPQGDSVETDVSTEIDYALLEWIYGERLNVQCDKLAFHLVRLARSWGLRDADCLQGRLARKFSLVKGKGTLAEDVLRAYEADTLEHRYVFLCTGAEEEEEDEVRRRVPAGCSSLLSSRSSYFRAMLSGSWAESRILDEKHELNRLEPVTIRIQWPRQQLHRLIRFIHGGCFVESQEDLPAAIECAKFFDVPCLVASVHEWISANLTKENASALWNLIDSETALKISDSELSQVCDDADTACFDFHMRHFEDLAQEVEQSESVSIHKLNITLMYRLVSSGMLDVPTAILKGHIKRYAEFHCVNKDLAAEMSRRFGPTFVLFNQDQRSRILGQAEISARTFV